MRWCISSQSIDTRNLLQRMTHSILDLRKLDEQLRMMNNGLLDPIECNGTVFEPHVFPVRCVKPAADFQQKK